MVLCILTGGWNGPRQARIEILLTILTSIAPGWPWTDFTWLHTAVLLVDFA